MPKTNRDFGRANEFLFGRELESDDSFQSKLSEEDRRRIETGELLPLDFHLQRIRRAVERDQTIGPPARESLNARLDQAAALINLLPRPPDANWEDWKGGRVWLLAYECIAIGSEMAAVLTEYGEIGNRVARDKHADRARNRAGETQRGRNRIRDTQIREFIQKRIDEGTIYKAALQDALDVWDERGWGEQISLERMRNLFAKQSFTTPDPT